MKSKFLWIYLSSSLTVAVMALSACGVENKPDPETRIAPSQIESSPPKFTASGSEPFWSMAWDGSALDIDVGVERNQQELSDFLITRNDAGWLMFKNGIAEMKVIQRTCVDLAGNENELEIDAIISGLRLVGCGNTNDVENLGAKPSSGTQANASTSSAAVTTEWKMKYSPDIPYINQTTSDIDVRSGPEIDADIISKLPPGRGNFLIECTTDFKRCSMNYKGMKKVGWVDMKLLGGRAH